MKNEGGDQLADTLNGMLGFVTLDPREADPKVESRAEPLPRLKRQGSAQKLQAHIE